MIQLHPFRSGVTWIGHLIFFCVFSSHVKYILNLEFLLWLVSIGVAFCWAEYLFRMGRFIFPCKDFGHVTCDQVEGSAGSLQALYQMWKYKLLLNNVSCIKLLIEWKVLDCLRWKSGIWLEGKILLLTETFKKSVFLDLYFWGFCHCSEMDFSYFGIGEGPSLISLPLHISLQSINIATDHSNCTRQKSWQRY